MELANLDRLDARLAEITNPADSAQLARDFKALAEVARGNKRDANLALLGYAKAARHTGKLLSRIPRTRGFAHSLHGATNYEEAVADCGIERTTAHRWQALADVKNISEETWLQWCVGVESGEIDAALKGVITAAHVGHNSGDNEWYTPEAYILAARDVMGGIDLDPASSATANEIVKAHEFYSIEDDGLSQPWVGRVWMNPPYAQPLVDRFCSRLAEAYSEGWVIAACALVNNATETAWFNNLASVAAAICFPLGRVRFWQPGTEAGAPLQGQAVIYCGDDPDAFAARFVQLGFVGILRH